MENPSNPQPQINLFQDQLCQTRLLSAELLLLRERSLILMRHSHNQLKNLFKFESWIETL